MIMLVQSVSDPVSLIDLYIDIDTVEESSSALTSDETGKAVMD